MSDTPHRHYTRWPDTEGYCVPQSLVAGGTVDVHVASRSSTFSAVVTRIGAQRTVVWQRTGMSADDHAVPDQAWARGCDWPVSFTIGTETGWPSGFYEMAFIADDLDTDDPRALSHAFFVVRNADRASTSPLLVLSTNTWQAYNQWGGRCMYSGAHQVSFRRPIERGYLNRPAAPHEVDFDGRITSIDDPPDPEHQRLQRYQAEGGYPLWTASSGWHNWERRFVIWAERAGYQLDYAVNSDLDGGAFEPGDRRLLLSVGHDEYWSWGMRDAVDAWVENGGNWAIFSGNTSFWQVRFSDDGSSMICHKGRARFEDPIAGTDEAHLLTSMWSDPLIGRPETSTIGLTFSRGGYHRIGEAVPAGAGAYTLHRPEHWAFAETDLRRGDQIGHGSYVVGYEVDGCDFVMHHGVPQPTGIDGAPDSLEILATCPARLISITDDNCEAPEALWASVDPPGDLEGTAMVLFGREWRDRVHEIANGHAVMASFTKGEGTVFNAGTADWAYGLDTDTRVQSITANVIDRLS